MAEVAEGCHGALEALLRRYATPLLTFIQRMTGDYHRGEELFQEVFLALWRKRHLYEYPRPFKTWLYAIAVNLCRLSCRQAHPVIALPENDIQVSPFHYASPISAAIATETSTIVAAALAVLPPQQRSVIVLRVWQQMSYSEIAQTLDTGESTVRSYMHHGLVSLRKHLEPRLGERG